MDDSSFPPNLSNLKKNSEKDHNLDQLAINAALSCNWEEAVKLNKKIIENEPENIGCLNRLARALMELGEYTKSQKLYSKVLEIDPYNIIAQKNLKRVSLCKKDSKHNLSSKETQGSSNGHASKQQMAISPNLFLEEPGTTTVINLVKVAEPQKILRLCAGFMVNLVPKSRGINVTDMDDNYLGALPDDTAFMLAKLIKGGNKYQALIKSVKSNGLGILVREVFRAKKFKQQPSFLSNGIAATYSSKLIILDEEMVMNDAGDDESED